MQTISVSHSCPISPWNWSSTDGTCEISAPETQVEPAHQNLEKTFQIPWKSFSVVLKSCSFQIPWHGSHDFHPVDFVQQSCGACSCPLSGRRAFEVRQGASRKFGKRMETALLWKLICTVCSIMMKRLWLSIWYRKRGQTIYTKTNNISRKFPAFGGVRNVTSTCTEWCTEPWVKTARSLRIKPSSGWKGDARLRMCRNAWSSQPV